MTKCTSEIPSNLGSSGFSDRGTSLHCSNSKEKSYWVKDRLYLTVTDPRLEKWIHTVADLLVIGIEDDAFRNNWNSLWTFLLENGAFEQFGKGREDGDVDSVSIAFTEEAVQKARQIGNQSLFDVYHGTAAFSPLDHVDSPRLV